MKKKNRWVIAGVLLFATVLAAAGIASVAKDKAEPAKQTESAAKTSCLLGVKGMTCSGCERSVRSALKSVPGFWMLKSATAMAKQW